MKLSTKVRYGTRAMLELAMSYGKGLTLIKDIAKNQKISEKYLEHLLVSIKSKGLVKSIRGAKGGYVLARPPAQIKISEVVEALDGPNLLVECIGNPRACSFTESCATRDVWIEIQNAINNICNSITLENLAERQREKKTISSRMYHI